MRRRKRRKRTITNPEPLDIPALLEAIAAADAELLGRLASDDDLAALMAEIQRADAELLASLQHADDDLTTFMASIEADERAVVAMIDRLLADDTAALLHVNVLHDFGVSGDDDTTVSMACPASKRRKISVNSE